MEMDPSKYKKEVSWSEEDKVFIARAPGIQGCAAHGDSETEALLNLNNAIVLCLESMAEHELEKMDGTAKFLLRMPTRMKQELVAEANRRDTSINELLITYINRGLEMSQHYVVGEKNKRKLNSLIKGRTKTVKHIFQDSGHTKGRGSKKRVG